MSLSDPLVSVIVLTYNSQDYVIETLESIKSQTYNNVELIISDDGSGDKTVSVCRDWLCENKHRFADYKVITVENNSGIPANCNRGIEVANGTWIKIIAGDDLLTPDCIYRNLKYSTSDMTRKIVISEMYAFQDGTKPMRIVAHRKPSGDVFSTHNTPDDQNKYLVKTMYFGNSPSLFYSKEVFDKVKFDESIPLMEDYPFAVLSTAAGFKFNYLPAVTVFYRVREGSGYFKNDNQIFGNFYKTKFQFDKKYRHSDLDFIRLNDEIFRYKLKLFFDKNDWNKNKPIYRIVFKALNALNPFRYLHYLKRKMAQLLKR
ncbi:MAG: glycosyltransferase [Bergeyella sp.]|nr:glycosyltransferase [Bergeyella sp.]